VSRAGVAAREAAGSFRSFPYFTAYVAVTLVVGGVIGLITFDVIDLGMTHFGTEEHRVHDATFGLLFSTAIVAIAVQLWRPQRQVASMQTALVPWLALILAGLLSSDVERVVLRNPSILMMPLTAITALLHPAGGTLLRSLSAPRVRPGTLMLVLVAAVPLLRWAATNLEHQRRLVDAHAEMGHYGFMAAFAFTVVGLGALASLRGDGRSFPTWVAGLLAIALGTISLLAPVSSSLTVVPAAAAILWGLAFIAGARPLDALLRAVR
jgi:hypothetical protein